MSTMIQSEGEEVSYELVDIPENDKDNELNVVLSELGVESMDDIMLKVYRINDMGREAHCFDCLPEAINGIEDRLRDSYGKGDYKIKVFAATSSGGKAVKKHIKLSIEVPMEKETVAIDNSGDDLKSVVATMMETMQQSQTNMMQMFKESQLESQNKTQEMLITILSNKDTGEKQPTLLETMAALKALTPDTKDPMEVFGQMLTMNREIKAEMTPETPAAEGSFGQLMEGANKLMDMASNAPKASPQMAPQQVHQQQPSLKPPETEEQEQTDMNALMKMRLKSSLNMLNGKAKAGKSSALWADVTIDEIPEQYYPQLMDALGGNNEEGFTNLMSINPVIEENKQWFIEFIGEIREAFISDGSGEGVVSDLTNDSVSGDDTGNKPLSEIITVDVDTETTSLPTTNESDA